MLTENDVVETVAAYLASTGYVVESTCTTVQTGPDIIARQDATGRHLRVEAKGGTSSKEHTSRYLKPFSPDQIKSHISRALYEAAVLRERHPSDEVALALPDDPHHCARVKAIDTTLSILGIRVYFVAHDQKVRLHAGH